MHIVGIDEDITLKVIHDLYWYWMLYKFDHFILHDFKSSLLHGYCQAITFEWNGLLLTIQHIPSTLCVCVDLISNSQIFLDSKGVGAGPAWLHTCMLLMKYMYCEQDHGQYSVVICYKTYLCTNNCHLKLTVLFIIMNIKLYCSQTCQIGDKKYKMICFKSLFAHLIILTLYCQRWVWKIYKV